MKEKIKTAIVMLNMGGPRTLDQVENFLKKLMTDRDLIQFPIMQDVFGAWMAKRRTPGLRRKYETIGGGSPIYRWTQTQGALLCKALDERSPKSAPHKHYVSFRYAKPSTEDAFGEVEEDEAERVVVFSQYPQYSCATSGSSFNAIYKHYQSRGFPGGVKMSVIDRWATNPLLVKTFAALTRKELMELPEEARKKAIILFSAHSLPLKAVNRGDSYPSEVGATVQLVMEELKHCNPYQLVWQSKVGPLPWLGPFTGDAIEQYVVKQAKKAFVLVPIAFVNEHVETLHEMDIEYCEDLAKKVGVEHIRRVSAPNDHPLFIEALVDVVKSHLDGGVPVNPKFFNLCPHCSNSRCWRSKAWFSEICCR